MTPLAPPKEIKPSPEYYKNWGAIGSRASTSAPSTRTFHKTTKKQPFNSQILFTLEMFAPMTSQTKYYTSILYRIHCRK